MTSYTIRSVDADEWRQVRDLRLAAVLDDAAPMAFASTYDEELSHPDEYWQGRTAGSSASVENAIARQFVAIADDGVWVGTVVALVERAGDHDWEGSVIEHSGTHLVGVFLRPEHRGAGVLDQLLDAALQWTRSLGLGRARLLVHVDNGRAQGAYRKAGFAPTGVELDGSLGREIEMARLV